MVRSFRLLGGLTILALPAAFGLEAVLIPRLLPSQAFEAIAWAEPYATGMAWSLAVGAGILASASRWLIGRSAGTRLRRVAEPQVDARRRALVASFLLSSSSVQIPGVFAILCHGLGAQLLPCLAALAGCTIGIALQYRWTAQRF